MHFYVRYHQVKNQVRFNKGKSPSVKGNRALEKYDTCQSMKKAEYKSTVSKNYNGDRTSHNQPV